MFSLVSWLTSSVSSVVEGWQKRRTVALEHELKVAEAATHARIERLKTSQQADISWERTALNTAGWKDEYLLIVFSIPLILCFIPSLDIYVQRGFAALDATPEWYQWSISIMVAASFGYRKIADFMALRKGD